MTEDLKDKTICVKCAHIILDEDDAYNSDCRLHPRINYVEGIDYGYDRCRNHNVMGTCQMYKAAVRNHDDLMAMLEEVLPGLEDGQRIITSVGNGTIEPELEKIRATLAKARGEK